MESFLVPENVEVLDNTYEWTSKGKNQNVQLYAGLERKMTNSLRLGASISYSVISTGTLYNPTSFYSYGIGYLTKYIGINPHLRYIKPIKAIDLYWKNSLSYYRLFSTQRSISEYQSVISKESFSSDVFRKNTFYTSTELGITFPISPKNKKVSVRGKFGLQLNVPLTDFIENDSSRFLYQGVNMGININFKRV